VAVVTIKTGDTVVPGHAVTVLVMVTVTVGFGHHCQLVVDGPVGVTISVRVGEPSVCGLRLSTGAVKTPLIEVDRDGKGQYHDHPGKPERSADQVEVLGNAVNTDTVVSSRR